MKRSLFGFLLVAFAAQAAPSPAARTALDPIWKDAVSALKDQSHQRAAELFDQWILEAAKTGIQSPEAHYNLALAEWALNNPGRSIQNFLQSSLLVTSPLQNVQNLALLADLEREIGIKESAAKSITFKSMLVLNENFTRLLLTVGFWIFVGTCFFRWRRNELGASLGITKALFLIPALLWTVAGAGTAVRTWGGDFAVLGDATEVSVFQKAGGTEKLIDLPAGTIVKLGPSKKGFLQIVEPVSGWIDERNARPVALPDKPATEVALLKN